jgi:hypothetical protein
MQQNTEEEDRVTVPSSRRANAIMMTKEEVRADKND